MLNHLQIIGNLGKDPEMRYTPAGTPVCTFPVATSEKFKDSSGEKREQTEWHSVVAWRGLAEVCGKYLHKGKTIYLSGRLQTRNWTDSDGVKRYKTELVAENMKMLGSNKKQDPEPQAQAPDPPEQPTYDPEDEIPF